MFINMNFIENIKDAGKIEISLSSGEKVELPLINITFDEWIGKTDFDFGKKPFINYNNEPIFAEFAILRLFINSGWSGVWVETYGGVHFLNSMPGDWKLNKNNISIPMDKEELLKSIWKAGKTKACFDIFIWKNDKVIFCESKHKGKDRLTKGQIKFIEGALSCGMTKDSLLIVEWEYKK